MLARSRQRSARSHIAHTPDDDLIAAPFADGHIATMVSASISPIIVVTISPIVIVPIIIATFTLTPAVGSDTEVQLSERDRRLGRDRITSTFGKCWESPHCASDGGDKRQFSHSNLLLCRHYKRGKQDDSSLVYRPPDRKSVEHILVPGAPITRAGAIRGLQSHVRD